MAFLWLKTVGIDPVFERLSGPCGFHFGLMCIEHAYGVNSDNYRSTIQPNDIKEFRAVIDALWEMEERVVAEKLKALYQKTLTLFHYDDDSVSVNSYPGWHHILDAVVQFMSFLECPSDIENLRWAAASAYAAVASGEHHQFSKQNNVNSLDSILMGTIEERSAACGDELRFQSTALKAAFLRITTA
jgi:hypothetical protein